MEYIIQATFDQLKDSTDPTKITLNSFFTALDSLNFGLTSTQTNTIFQNKFGSGITSIEYTDFKNSVLNGVLSNYMPNDHITTVSFGLISNDNEFITDESYLDNYVTTINNSSDVVPFKDNFKRLANVTLLEKINKIKYTEALTQALIELE